ncbi:Phosphatidylinositol 4-phosphate 5-kinase 1 [Hondaea fermentalgiana]|uniref:Phosphatidylinositol 4-phosphate 5-kinase 1 n=1 Tax=Hondaea fermentalgiana TaxID=2315210 RepID=A0A2R5GX68_9STRA|nr:Phosphatidylinositol 4-phosphate 5-kinase 1 [Hondaea fermentalgiana]|eukprot:GBG33283.1 Phosphatidylinositol 4-phosphate 5-kinase 1 [Hondaea fermentalgiana]
MQAVARGRLGRKRREELLLEQKRVVPKGVPLRILLMRSRVLRKVDTWKEMRDAETNAVFYYNTANTETQWDPPFEMNQGRFDCNWGHCELSFESFEALEIHRREHNWLCPACWHLNHCDIFPHCSNCSNNLDIDGHHMGEIVPEALTNQELLMHLQARKLGIFASRQDMISKLNDILMRERKFKQREQSRRRRTTCQHSSTESPSNAPEANNEDILPILRPRLSIEPVPDDRWPHFSMVEARAALEARRASDDGDDASKSDFLDMDTFKRELARLQQEGACKPVGLDENASEDNSIRRNESSKTKSVKRKKKPPKRKGPFRIPDHIDPQTVYSDKVRNGRGTRRIGTALYTGPLVQGQLCGNGTLRYGDGSEYRGDFRDNVRHGKGTLRKADGTIFQGEWRYNLRHGFGVETSPAGDKLEGRWSHGFIEGKGQLASANGDTFCGDFCRGKFHGTGTFTKANGDTFVGRIKDGAAEGPGILKIALNNEVYRGHFFKDNRHGYGVCSYGSNFVYTGTWLAGRYDGHGRLENIATGELYDGTWELGRMGGAGILVLANGDIFDGKFSGGTACGQGTYLYRKSGCVYVGNWKQSKKHGQGQLYFGSGAHYVGTFFKGSLHGIGIFTYKDGSVYHGAFFRGKRNGRGKYTFANGNVLQGEFAENKINGEGVMVYTKHGHRYEGQWKNNQRHGMGTMYFNDTSVYTGEFSHDRMTGTGCFTTNPGTVLQEVYEGDILDGCRHGRGKFTDKSGAVYEGDWLKNKRHGQGRFDDCAGFCYEGAFVNDAFSGRGIATYPDGSCYRGDWQGGLMHGEGTLTKANGHVFTGVFIHGQRHGQGRVKYPKTIPYAQAENAFVGSWLADKRSGFGTYLLNCRSQPSRTGDHASRSPGQSPDAGDSRGEIDHDNTSDSNGELILIPGDPDTDPMGDALGQLVKVRVFAS